MKIYLVSRNDRIDYDQYDSFVCVAEDENAARNMSPDSCEWNENWNVWIARDRVGELTVKYVGEAEFGEDPYVVCASFNAG